MRAYRPQFTVRELLIAVAMVALALWSVMMWVRSEEYRWQAKIHAHIEEGSYQFAKDGNLPRAYALRRAVYHGWIKRRYEYAATHPWVLLPPDPPEPTP